nr:hypothetical protein [Tanacetum cinerariifolium]
MDGHVHDEIDGVMYHTNSDASISGKEGDLETWRGYEMDQQDNEFLVLKHDHTIVVMKWLLKWWKTKED